MQLTHPAPKKKMNLKRLKINNSVLQILALNSNQTASYLGSIWWEIDYLGIHSRVIKTSFLAYIGPKNKIAAISSTSSCTDYVISGHGGQKPVCKILLQK